MIENPDITTVRAMREAIAHNDGYCPCSLIREEDTLCPCREMRENEKCKCKLFVKP